MPTHAKTPPLTLRELDLHLSLAIVAAAEAVEDNKRSKESSENLLATLQTLRRQMKEEK